MIGSDKVTIDSDSESEGSKEEEEELTKEVINKEAPEGIEY